MSDSNWWIEIVFLAMLAGFIALRLVSVLGRRTGHENPAPTGYPGGPAEVAAPGAGNGDVRQPALVNLPADIDPSLREPLQAIADADTSFDPARFTEGAKAAYRMILEAFWKGDAPALDGLVSDDVAADFRAAIAAREEQGVTLDNRIVRIEGSRIVGANVSGMMAEVTVRFDADLVAVTRDKDGNVVAGSTSDAVQTHDLWTFSRHMGSADPNWLLIETDDEA
ncbi:Tim44/TimA family putative adaptor protein [Sphingoaurantiacus capsulatus]|uniref:Tim44/TimA family putative adaptor protein n=1 Tax=Sphingoaurantiacus capsulatus TaxID=1771310 RepID=A0ABV7XAU4_9SPHN